MAGWANSRPSELPPPVYCARGHVPESRGQRSWPAAGHSLVTSLVTGLLPRDQGGAEGRTLLRTLPKGPGPWHGGAAPRSSECPVQREWGFLRAGDWFCTKWISVHPGWPGGPSETALLVFLLTQVLLH